MASVTVTAESYTVNSFSGQRLTSLTWKKPKGELRPIQEVANFEPVRQMLSQPIISMLPLAMGPFFILSNFDKDWTTASVRPLETSVEVDVEYVPGYGGGRYPASGWSRGIDSSVIGSYELRALWRLSLPYPPLFASRT
jgi:hypothetical protein